MGSSRMRADDAAGHAASAMTYVVSDGLDVALTIVALMLVTRIEMAYSENIVEHGAARDGDSAA